jgi:uncharacterized protein (TIGR02594 family)
MVNKDLILRLLSQYGVKEMVGNKHNPTILEYFRVAGHSWVKDDETSWCSALIIWAAISEGYEHSKLLNARSWLEIGLKVIEPQMGDIVVFWRISKNSPYGHVAMYIYEDEEYVYVLGGNQSNMVKISAYPKSQVLGYRRLNKE